MNKMRKTQSVGQGFRYPLPLGIGQFYNLTTFSLRKPRRGWRRGALLPLQLEKILKIIKKIKNKKF